MVCKLSGAVLVFVSLCLQYAVCLNAKLTTQMGSGVLTCAYIGDKNVTAVQFYNSTTPNPLILKRNDSDGSWYVFSKNTSPFDMDRIVYSCNSDNICTLEIKPLLPIDENVNISCTFLDPDPGEPKAYATILLKGTTGSKTLSVGEIAAIVIVLVLAAVGVGGVAFMWNYIRKSKSVSQKEETSPINGHVTFLPSTEQQESEHQHMVDIGQDTEMEGVNCVENNSV